MATGILGSGSLWSCHLLLLHLSSVKHPRLVQSAASQDRGKKGSKEKRKRQPQAGHTEHTGQASLEEEALETRRVGGGGERRQGGGGERERKRERENKTMWLSFRISKQASAGGHRHIQLPSTQPLMRDVGGGGDAEEGWSREGSCAEPCAGPVRSAARGGLKWRDKDCEEGWTRRRTEPQSLDKWP